MRRLSVQIRPRHDFQYDAARHPGLSLNIRATTAGYNRSSSITFVTGDRRCWVHLSVLCGDHGRTIAFCAVFFSFFSTDCCVAICRRRRYMGGQCMFTSFKIEIPYIRESCLNTLRFSELCYYLGVIFWGILQRPLVVIVCMWSSAAICKHAY
jgi:hypothetical protein